MVIGNRWDGGGVVLFFYVLGYYILIYFKVFFMIFD